MPTLNEVLDRLDELLAEVDRLDEAVREPVLELLDGIEALHRMALERLPAVLGDEEVERLRAADPALGWLLETYGLAADQRAAADRALDWVRPYIHSHGGEVELLDASAGVVRVRLVGACSGCAASVITLREGVEAALRDGVPGFQRLEVAPDQGSPHPAPGPTLLQIETATRGAPLAPARPDPTLLQIGTAVPPAPPDPTLPPVEVLGARPAVVVVHHGA